jgi:hypothetical protein
LIKKTTPPVGDGIKKTEVEEPLRFSFRYFTNDADLCPKSYIDNYAQKLAERLKELSNWTLKRFTSDFQQEVKNHRINWAQTSRKDGFGNILPPQVRDSEPWQFSVTRNEHGRVHGFLIGNTFYIVWLDCNHRLYPGA